MFVDQAVYRKTFQDYIRKGTPIGWSIKREQRGTHYIWRTKRDGKVRSTHADREGQIFAWDSPPEGGHPGEDYGCRCTAEPYLPDQSEFMSINLQNVSNSGSAWNSRDFVRHYYRGNGRGVTVRATGHLAAIVEQYMSEVDGKLKQQIAIKARNERNGSFRYTFGRPYDMTSLVFSIGDTTIGGVFTGFTQETKSMLELEGSFAFYLKDEFADPADIGEIQRQLGREDPQDVDIVDPSRLGEMIYENIHRPLDNYIRGRAGLPRRGSDRLGVITGTPYTISDTWSGTLRGKIYLDASRRAYA